MQWRAVKVGAAGMGGVEVGAVEMSADKPGQPLFIYQPSWLYMFRLL